jgi:hypothetical protein
MESGRLDFTDWLRVDVAPSLIPFHTVLSYTGFLSDSFMNLLSFVSGTGAYSSLKRRSSRPTEREPSVQDENGAFPTSRERCHYGSSALGRVNRPGVSTGGFRVRMEERWRTSATPG